MSDTQLPAQGEGAHVVGVDSSRDVQPGPSVIADFGVSDELRKPGAALRMVRENLGMSCEQVAAQTRISVKKIDALEMDDYSAMGPEIFILGYIRKYAALVKLDGEHMVERYKHYRYPDEAERAIGADEQKTIAEQPRDKKSVQASGHHTNAMLTEPAAKGFKYPFMVLIGVVVGIWVVASFMIKSPRPPELAPHIATESTLEVNGDPSATSIGLASTLAHTSADTGSAEVTQAEAKVTESKEATATIREGADVLTDTHAAQPSIPLAVPEGVLAFTFIEDCWLEVSDASGQRIFAQLKRRGDNLTLSGVAPFSLKLGNARAVKLLYNDQSVTIPVRPNQKTLRFSVPVR